MMEEDDATIQHNDFGEDRAEHKALRYKARWVHKEEHLAHKREKWAIQEWERYNKNHNIHKKGDKDSKKDYEVADPSEFLF